MNKIKNITLFALFVLLNNGIMSESMEDDFVKTYKLFEIFKSECKKSIVILKSQIELEEEAKKATIYIEDYSVDTTDLEDKLYFIEEQQEYSIEQWGKMISEYEINIRKYKNKYVDYKKQVNTKKVNLPKYMEYENLITRLRINDFKEYVDLDLIVDKQIINNGYEEIAKIIKEARKEVYIHLEKLKETEKILYENTRQYYKILILCGEYKND